MKLKKIALTFGALALLASTAFAGSTVTGQGYFVSNAEAGNIPEDFGTLPAANFTFNVGYTMNFTAGGNHYSNNDFMNSGGASNIMDISGRSLNDAMSDNSTYGTIYQFTGTAYFVNGQSYSISHDDGVIAYVGSTKEIDSPLDQSEHTSCFTWLGATGNQSFDFLYGECCGAPAVFQTTLAAPTPEPGSMLLFGTGLLSLAGFARRKFNR